MLKIYYVLMNIMHMKNIFVMNMNYDPNKNNNLELNIYLT